MELAMVDAKCPHFENCHLKRIENLAGNAEMIRELYCCGDPVNCETYRRLEGIKVEGEEHLGDNFSAVGITPQVSVAETLNEKVNVIEWVKSTLEKYKQGELSSARAKIDLLNLVSSARTTDEIETARNAYNYVKEAPEPIDA